MVFPALCPQPPEPLLRILLYALDHHHKITPFHGIAVRFGIVFRHFEAAGLQTFYIHHHASVFRMKQLHESAAGSDEDEDITVLHFAPHPFMYQTAQRTDSLAHICPAGAQEVAHRVVQAKHGCSGGFGSVIPSAISQTRSRSGHGVRWETVETHPEVFVLPGPVP